MKRELGLDKAEVELEGTFIENPEWKFRHGINIDVDIAEEDMDEETRELNKLFDEGDAEGEGEEEELDENFILNLNAGQKMIEEKQEEDLKEEEEPQPDHGFLPPGLSEEAKQMLIRAREILKQRR